MPHIPKKPKSKQTYGKMNEIQNFARWIIYASDCKFWKEIWPLQRIPYFYSKIIFTRDKKFPGIKWKLIWIWIHQLFREQIFSFNTSNLLKEMITIRLFWVLTNIIQRHINHLNAMAKPIFLLGWRKKKKNKPTTKRSCRYCISHTYS